MADGDSAVTVKVASRIADISAEAWDSCAGDDNPFISHAFLNTLEESGSATRESGWLPQHIVVEDRSGRIVGAAPCYLKSHSYGEYVFDWGWADAYQRAGGGPYPHAQGALPFTPGSRARPTARAAGRRWIRTNRAGPTPVRRRSRAQGTRPPRIGSRH